MSALYSNKLLRSFLRESLQQKVTSILYAYWYLDYNWYLIIIITANLLINIYISKWIINILKKKKIHIKYFYVLKKNRQANIICQICNKKNVALESGCKLQMEEVKWPHLLPEEPFLSIKPCKWLFIGTQLSFWGSEEFYKVII